MAPLLAGGPFHPKSRAGCVFRWIVWIRRRDERVALVRTSTRHRWKPCSSSSLTTVSCAATPRLKLALDIRDMRATDDLDQKKNIYTNGANALPLTLRDLSLNSSVYNKFPLYNVYTYAFYELGITLEQDQEGNFDGNPVEQYADTLVGDLFALNRTRIEADGALVLGVTMAYWGSLGLMLNACERQDDASIMVSYLDQGMF